MTETASLCGAAETTDSGAAGPPYANVGWTATGFCIKAERDAVRCRIEPSAIICSRDCTCGCCHRAARERWYMAAAR